MQQRAPSAYTKQAYECVYKLPQGRSTVGHNAHDTVQKKSFFDFSVLCRARYVQQLKVLEAVCIRFHKPVLCKQKEHVVALKLYS